MEKRTAKSNARHKAGFPVLVLAVCCAVRTAACGWFTTVLGPGSDAFHASNMHLDIELHGSSGSYRICE